jgi:hypothetical protein
MATKKKTRKIGKKTAKRSPKAKKPSRAKRSTKAKKAASSVIG